MALFVISYTDKPGSLALRLATREAHLAYAHSKEAPAKVRLGGPYLDDKGDMNGSLIVVECATRDGAVAFADNSPYVKAGLFQSVDIRPFRITVNHMAGLT